MLQRVWRKWNPPNSVGMQPLWKTVWRFFRKLKTELPCDLAIPLLGMYLEKTLTRKDICNPMFIAALLQLPGHGNNPSVHQQRTGLRKGSIQMQIGTDIDI